MTEIKKILALQLFDWSLDLMPNCKFKDELNKVVVDHLMDGMD